ncbi:MAG: hypothetical protein J6A25_13840 [Lachnospiraceae bacterium]|nr:hypothetical protein [Lachnospiraceae bacterium]
MNGNKKNFIAYILFTIAIFGFGDALYKIIPSGEIIVFSYIAFCIYALCKYNNDKEIALLFLLFIILIIVFSKLSDKNISLDFDDLNKSFSISFFLLTTYFILGIYVLFVIPIRFVFKSINKSSKNTEMRNNLLQEQNELIRQQNDLLAQNLAKKQSEQNDLEGN